MKLKIKKTVEVPKVAIETTKVLIDLPTLAKTPQVLSQELTEALFAWKSIGNLWATSIEINNYLSSKGLKTFSEKEVKLDCIRALHFLGYLTRREPNMGETVPVARYKLSPKGLEAIAGVSIFPPEDPETGLCPNCNGDCVLEDGEICSECDGTGEVKEVVKKTRGPKKKPAVVEKKKVSIKIRKK